MNLSALGQHPPADRPSRLRLRESPAFVEHHVINVALGVIPEPTISETASLAIYGSLTTVYPILTILALQWLHKQTPETAQPA